MSNWNIRLPLAAPIVNPFLGIPPHPTKCQATYIWIDGSGENLRSKARILATIPDDIKDYPQWTYDGSSTGQASGHESDLYLKPVAAYVDPFTGGQNRLVLCETWPKNGFPKAQGDYYCGLGADHVFGREVVETHSRACLQAGIELCGTNAEVTPGQWEFQVGVVEGIKMGDHLWMARYLLHRTAEQFGVIATLDPKPTVTLQGEWNGAGCHTNFNGIEHIIKAMDKLSVAHEQHLKVYDPHQGRDNSRRLTGKFETSSMSKFTWGIADRSASVRIPIQVDKDRCGYLEDRRPSSNCDPYVVTAAIAKTILID